MEESPSIAALAAQLADPARARMLLALMGGRALTVSELAQAAGLGKAGASAQVTRLEEAGLLAARRQGRHKYLALAGPHVARLVELLMTVAAEVGVAKAPPTGLAQGRATRRCGRRGCATTIWRARWGCRCIAACPLAASLPPMAKGWC